MKREAPIVKVVKEGVWFWGLVGLAATSPLIGAVDYATRNSSSNAGAAVFGLACFALGVVAAAKGVEFGIGVGLGLAAGVVMTVGWPLGLVATAIVYPTWLLAWVAIHLPRLWKKTWRYAKSLRIFRLRSLKEEAKAAGPLEV